MNSNVFKPGSKYSSVQFSSLYHGIGTNISILSPCMASRLTINSYQTSSMSKLECRQRKVPTCIQLASMVAAGERTVYGQVRTHGKNK